MEIIARDEKDMTDEELHRRCIACKESVVRALSRGTDLIGELRARAHHSFC
jgi:hypothetical protein